MKQKLFWRASVLLLALILISTVSLTSCSLLLDPSYSDILDSVDTDGLSSDTEVGAEDNDSKEDAVQNVTNNTVTITGNEDNITYATACGLRSAVSVYCTFSATSGGTSYWNPTPSTYSYYTTGSGIIYRLENDGSAFVVTNHHVVYDASSNTENGISDKIYVYLYGMENQAYAIPATYVGGSASYDIAVLRVEKSDVLKDAIASGSASAVSVGDSDGVVPGMTTIAIGNPSASDGELGGLSVTQGIVSVDSEYITKTANDGSGEITVRVIRTDAPVNSGNSGGGMFNGKGELIGIVNAKISSSSVENIGYAIPSNVVRAVADNIIDYCYGTDCESVMRGILGITVETTACSTEYDTETGLIVKRETVGVYAVNAGGLGDGMLKVGDTVKAITVGERTVTVTRQYHLIDAMLDVRVGDSVSMVIIRDGEEMTVNTTITEDCLTAY